MSIFRSACLSLRAESSIWKARFSQTMMLRRFRVSKSLANLSVISQKRFQGSNDNTITELPSDEQCSLQNDSILQDFNTRIQDVSFKKKIQEIIRYILKGVHFWCAYFFCTYKSNHGFFWYKSTLKWWFSDHKEENKHNISLDEDDGSVEIFVKELIIGNYIRWKQTWIDVHRNTHTLQVL